MAQVMGILLVEDRNTYTHTYGLSSIYHVSANDDLVMLARNHIGMKFSSWNISISVPEWSNCFFFNMRTSMRFCPSSTRRNDNVITTSKRSRFDVIMTYFCVVCPLGVYTFSYIRLCMISVLSFPGIWQLCTQRENGSNGMVRVTILERVSGK